MARLARYRGRLHNHNRGYGQLEGRAGSAANEVG